MTRSGGDRPHYRTLALIVGAAIFMEQMDGTVLATALPGMARDLGVGAPSLSIALTAYLISLAMFIPVSGWLADRFGAKRVFRSAILVFTLASALCAFAPSLSFLVGARFLQGMGGAMMIPVGRLLLFRSIEKRQMVDAMAWVLVPAMLGPIVGPPVGGFIVAALDWRWIFLLNLPIGCLGLWLAGRHIAEVPAEAGPLDRLGMVLAALALGPLLFGLELVSHPRAIAYGGLLLLFGAGAGALYLRHARRVRDPILDPALMRIPTFRTAMIAGSFTRFTQGAHPFLIPLTLQLGFGWSPLHSGLMTLGTALGAALMKAVAPQVLRRFGFRDSLVAGGLLAAGSYGVCAFFTPDWPVWAMFAVLVAAGFFMSFQFTAYNTIAYDGISQARMSSANAFYITFQQLMLSVGICVAAMGLKAAMSWRGHDTPVLADFQIAWLIVCGLSLLAVIWNLRFRPEDGVEFSGHTPRTWSVRQALRDMRGLNPK